MINFNLVQTFEAERARKRTAQQSSQPDAELGLRLMKAFMAISTQEDRVKLVQMAEGLVDPIWDY
jgi:hypothetical protein